MLSTPRLLVSMVAILLLILSGAEERLGARNHRSVQRATFQGDRSAEPKYVSGQVLVRFKPTASQKAMNSAHRFLGATPLRQVESVDRLQIAALPEGLDVREAVRKYQANPDVLYVEPNFIVHALGTPNDPQFHSQWNLENTGQAGGTPGADIRATRAWDQSTGSSSVVVAVLDSGVDYTHPDLAQNLWTAASPFAATRLDGLVINCPAGSHGLDFENTDCDPQDDNGHGTHVSGIIGAAGNNGIGVAGVNWNVQILPCKFLNYGGGGSIGGAITCLDLVRSLKLAGVNIVATNNSWGGLESSQALADAIDAQRQAGILFIAAAGNDFWNNDRVPIYPANYYLPNVISVASSNRYEDLSLFSNFGLRSVHLAAPGEEILSTTPNNTYSVFSGTSMAAPHVAGVAALLAAQNSSRDWRTIKNFMLAGGDTVPAFAQTITGKRLNADGALSCSGQTVSRRVQPILDVISGTVGQPTSFAALYINCGQPGGNLSAQLTPGNVSVTLLDDGMGADLAGGDGIYTGVWVPSAGGNYTLTFPWGDAFQVEILANYSSAPDPFHYEVITGTNLDLGDDSVAAITSPFPVSFGGGSFSELFIGANGTISFTDGNAGYLNRPLPPPEMLFQERIPQPFTLVAPFWQDLYPVRGTAQNVFWTVQGAAPNRELVVEWRDVRSYFCHTDANATVKFQVVMQEGSDDIHFNYADTAFGGRCATQDHGGEAVIGIQESPSAGQQWSYYSQAAGNGTSVLWQIPAGAPQPNPIPSINSVSPTSAVVYGPGFSLTVNGNNFTPASRVQWNGKDRVTQFVSSTQLTAIIPATDLASYAPPPAGDVAVSNPPPGGGLSAHMSVALLLPAPSIASLSPVSVPAGWVSFQLELTGSNFFFGGTVNWNGQALTTLWKSLDRVFGFVPYNLILNPGTAQITYSNPGASGNVSNAMTFSITAPQPSKAGPDNVQPIDPQSSAPLTSPPPRPMRFMGWNNARMMGPEYLKYFARPHRATAPPLPSSKQSVKSHLAEARVAAAAELAAPSSLPGFALNKPLPADFLPTGVATGDFNRDGKMDWVVCHGGSNNLWIYIGNGDGTSQLPVVIALNGQSPLNVIAADLRNNGILDLIVAEIDSGTVGILSGNGDGTFAPEATISLPAPPVSIAAGDFNGDGNADIVAGLLGNLFTGPLALLPGNGTGKFGPSITTPVPLTGGSAIDPYVLNVADLDADGLPDLVIAELGGGVYSYMSAGDGTFKLGQFVVGSGRFIAVTNAAVGDLNEDGCLDIVEATTAELTFVFGGHCDGTFENFPNVGQFGAGDVQGGLGVADVNGDGHLDVISSGIQQSWAGGVFGTPAGNLVMVQFGDGRGNLGQGKVFRGQPSMFVLTLADLNGDSRLDVVTADQDSDTASVFLNDGQGGFGRSTGAYIGYSIGGNFGGPLNAPHGGIVARDVNGDGFSDLVLLEFMQFAGETWKLTALLNDGTGRFSLPIRSDALGSALSPVDFILGDFGNPGLPDLVMLGVNINASPAFLAFAKNHGDGYFGPLKTTQIAGGRGILGVGDFNGDGNTDVIVPQADAVGQIAMELGNGDGTFRAGPTTTYDVTHWWNGEPRSIFVQDFNHDGKLDFLLWGVNYITSTNALTSPVLEFLGNGDGTFQTEKTLFSSVSGITLSDLNHDGLTDFILYFIQPPVGGTPSVEYSTFLGQPDGSLVSGVASQPFPGDQPSPFFTLAGPTPHQAAGPLVGDFNGDGNLDIAVYQQPPLTNLFGFLTASRMAALLGNGDGSFTPFHGLTDFGIAHVPQAAAELTGDGRADLIQLSGFVSSFHIIPAAPGKSIDSRLVTNPLVGSQGTLRLYLSLPSATDTVVQLSASDSNINIPATATIPAGSLTQDVPYTVGTGFDPSHVYALRATLGSDVATSHGTKAFGKNLPGFKMLLGYPSAQVVQPGGTTQPYPVGVDSINGYSTVVQLSCAGLPSGATCVFSANSLELPIAGEIGTSLVVQTSSAIPLGSYPFTVIVTDGTITDQATGTLNIADFTLSISPASASVTVGNFVSFAVTMGAIFGWTDAVPLTCNISPPSLTCLQLGGQIAPGVSTLRVDARSAQAGDYAIALTAGSGNLTRTANAQLHVQDVSGSLSSTAATINVGGSANFNVTLSSQNGLTDQFTFRCQIPKSGASCGFNPASGTLPANGSLTAVLTVTISSRPSLAPPSVWNPPVIGWARLLSLALVAAFLLVLASMQKSRLPRRAPALLFLLVLLVGMEACGGGGGSSGSGPPPPPPPQPSTTVSISVEATSPSLTKSIGTVTITVP